ncbi:MAG: hypothetical protein GY861_12455 [bacterium]|nr:hypothetical protein [bacterium]
MGFAEAFKNISPVMFMNEAAVNDWDYKTFVVKASQKGIMDSPNVLAYAQILKDKQDRQLAVKERERVKGEGVAKREEFNRVWDMGQPQSAQPQPTQSQPEVEGPTRYQEDVWEEIPQEREAARQAQATQQTQVAPQETQVPDPWTRGLAYRETKSGIFHSAKDFEDTGAKYMQTAKDILDRELEENKLKASKENKGQRDELAWLIYYLRLRNEEGNEVKSLNANYTRSKEKENLQEGLVNDLNGQIAVLREEGLALEKLLPEAEKIANDPSIYDEKEKAANKKALTDLKAQIAKNAEKTKSTQEKFTAANIKRITMAREADKDGVALGESVKGELISGIGKSIQVGTEGMLPTREHRGREFPVTPGTTPASQGRRIPAAGQPSTQKKPLSSFFNKKR